MKEKLRGKICDVWFIVCLDVIFIFVPTCNSYVYGSDGYVYGESLVNSCFLLSCFKFVYLWKKDTIDILATLWICEGMFVCVCVGFVRDRKDALYMHQTTDVGDGLLIAQNCI